MNLKRVWDTTEKKIARVPWANGKPCQVWYKVGEEKFYKQDINGLVEITDEDINVYWPNWDIMNTDDVLGYYDTNEPTELFSPEDWDEATYTFKDYDGTVLDTGIVKDWETPVAPEDPTREGYEFTGWKPKVKPIYKDTTYTAQYKENLCTVTFNAKNIIWDDEAWEFVETESQDPLRATREPVSVQVPAGCCFENWLPVVDGEGEIIDERQNIIDFFMPTEDHELPNPPEWIYTSVEFTGTSDNFSWATYDDDYMQAETIEGLEWNSDMSCWSVVWDVAIPTLLVKNINMPEEEENP